VVHRASDGRRHRLTPADVGLPDVGLPDVGLPAGTRRRTAGLRREEVAQLAGVSATYYTFLEQGRDVRSSRQVVTALAGALRLSSAERAHLFQLAGFAVAADDHAQAETVTPVLSAMVGRLDPFPAYLKGRRWDVLAANRAARALFTDWPARPHQASPEVRSWWPRHDVAPVSGGTKHLHHPALGDVAFQRTVLQVADHPEQMLVYFSTDEVPAAKLGALADGIG
jgi:transcriptional regulator with XRE-family HTH domain